MSSHQLAIAKASFSAGLLRPDPTSVSRDSIEHFHALLNATTTQCSPKNVQKCKYWILDNVASSAARFTSLGKYLNALSASFATPADGKGARESSIKRKRLHILYLVNDILHHGKVHSKDMSMYGKVQPMLMGLVGSAASFKNCPKHQKKIQELLSIWEEKDYYGAGYVDKLKETAKNAAESRDVAGDATLSGLKDEDLSKSTKSTPYVMPASHGDSSTSWFDLPAANLMPHIVPNSTKPINPDMIKPLRFVAGPADEALITAVKALLDDVDIIYGESNQDERDSWDIDELGQPIILDEFTGDAIGGEGYYGWSQKFCENMKRRKKGLNTSGIDQGRGRDSRSRSRSSSRSVRKRRYDDSGDESSQERYRSRQRRRSYSSSRSPSPDQGRDKRSRGNSRNRYTSPRRSPSPPRRTISQPNEPIPPPNPYQQNMPYPPPPPHMAFQHGFNPNIPPPPPPNNPYNSGQTFNAPPGQNPQFGAWPPPPPQNMNFNPSQNWPPPPPPPPPGNSPMNFQQHHPSQQQFPPFPPGGPGSWQQQGDGRGYNNNNGNNNGWNNTPPNRGRGNFRGRGRGW